MKKIISVILTAVISASLLVGCGGGGGDNNRPPVATGKTGASLLLANERLNAKLLSDNNIFDNGTAVLRNLSRLASESVATYAYATDSQKSELSLTTSYESLDGSVVEIDGNTYRWSGFKEYSNSYNYFLNLTTGVSGSAERGAALIDNVKTYVRVIDKWVSVHGNEYYLHVEENCEILYERLDDFITMCMRTKTEDGYDRYEVYTSNSEGGVMRMIYTPGKICEYSYVTDGFNHNFLAENNKGFWEVVDVGRINDNDGLRFNVSCMVIKNDICYDAFYSPAQDTRGVGTIKVISSDRLTDIIELTQYEDSAFVTVNLQGFNGYKYLETIATPDQVGRFEDIDNIRDGIKILYSETPLGDRVYRPYLGSNAEVVLDNGNRITVDDTYARGNIDIYAINVHHFSKEPEDADSFIYSNGYVPTIGMSVNGTNSTEIMAYIEEFLTETGLTCTRDMDYVKTGIIRAYEELEQFVQYHEWNESRIYSDEELEVGWQNNLAKFEAYAEMYDRIKDLEVIDFTDEEAYELNIHFAPITFQSALNISNDGLYIDIKNLELGIADTTLFVEGESYTVGFALASASGKGQLNHIESTAASPVTYEGGSEFKVIASTYFEIKPLTAGEYVLVAYISTTDGIRMTGFTPLAIPSIIPAEANAGNVKTSISKNADGNLAVSCSFITEIEIELPKASYTAKSMYEALGTEIYEYAFVAEGAVLEVLLEDGSWSADINGTGTLANGTYRLKYELKNGNVEVNGFVYTEYTAP